MVKKVTFVDFRGGDRPNRPPPLDLPLHGTESSLWCLSAQTKSYLISIALQQ